MRTPILRTLAAAGAVLLAACADGPTAPGGGGPQPPPQPLGVYEIRITGLGGEADQMRSTIRPPIPAGGASQALTPLGSGIVFEQLSSASFTEGSRTQGGQRYVSFTYRVRNGTGAPISNLTLMMVSKPGTIGGTPLSAIRRFDGTNADSTIARYIVPTGSVLLGRDGVTMESAYADVMQAFTEAEVAAITPPAGVSYIFPYGYVVRRANSQGTRMLPASADADRYDGIMTVSFRVPLQASSTLDVYSLSFQVLAVDDSQVRLTESIEEQTVQGRAKVTAAAASLGATMVTVLNGSPSTGYPGQRQICSLRTAGTAASPLTYVNSPGAYTRLALYRPGESTSACGVDFRSGTPQRVGVRVPQAVTVRAMDRYGNTLPVADSVYLSSPDYDLTTTAGGLLSGGTRGFTISFADYATPTLEIKGHRLLTSLLLPVVPISRTWTGTVSTNWSTDGNWGVGTAPASLDTAVIPSGTPFQPALTAAVGIGGVSVANGATVTLGAFDLTAANDVVTGQVSGGITSGTGRVVLAGASGRVAGRLHLVQVTGGYQLSGNLLTRTPAEIALGGGLETQGYLAEFRWY